MWPNVSRQYKPLVVCVLCVDSELEVCPSSAFPARSLNMYLKVKKEKGLTDRVSLAICDHTVLPAT